MFHQEKQYAGYRKSHCSGSKHLPQHQQGKIFASYIGNYAFDYNKITNLASEAKQKLNEIRPTSLGQAMRISGVNPSDISILTVYMKRYFKND